MFAKKKLHIFHLLGTQHLQPLSSALQDGRISTPLSVSMISSYVPSEQASEVYQALQELITEGWKLKHLASSLQWILEEKRTNQRLEDRLSLVWTGPKVVGSTLRDTAVVMKELFQQAKASVVISTYSLDKPENLKILFGDLAEKMDNNSHLSVRLFVNIGRSYGDIRASSVLIREFADRFRASLWPGKRLPKVFHDPRALEPKADKRACLHAKCVIIDDAHLFITSANFSEAAQLRNIETGMLLKDNHHATTMRQHFDALVESGDLELVAGLE
ncbi:MAG: phospholipase [Myxococcales bacterium]|nr:phospholipase [Myxococcales bacterium]